MSGLVIKPFLPGEATEAELAGYYRVVASAQEVDQPAEPRLTYETVIGRLDSPFPGLGPATYWAAHQDGELVAAAKAHFPEAENQHIAVVDVIVAPPYRRRGIGTMLLAAVVDGVRERGRAAVEGWQVVKGSPGEQWTQALGFRPVRQIAIQALTMAAADTHRWNVDVPAGYRLRKWQGSAPDDLVESYAKARTAIQDAPTGDSTFDHPVWTVARLREHEAQLRQQQIEQRCVVALHVMTGSVAALTEIMIPPHRPNWAYQGDTAVLEAHRGHGLGLCIKAAMVRWLLGGHPGLERIQTATSADNAHMIRVNHQLGFDTIRTLVAMSGDIETIG